MSAAIQNAIDDFVITFKQHAVKDYETNETLDLREIAARLNVLPLVFDLGVSWGIRPNGAVILFTIENSPETETVENQKMINIVLFDAAKNYPELSELMPVCNPESIVCPGCDGTGIIKEFADHELLSKATRCNCGGLGWLPSADPKDLFF